MRHPRLLIVMSALLAVGLAGCGGGPTSGSTGSRGPSPSPPPLPTLAEAATTASSAVTRIEVVDCEGLVGSGSGFLLEPDLVATAAHVVEGARHISVRNATGVARGTVEHLDEDQDLALVRMAHEVPGSVLTFASDQPETLEDVAVLGYPWGLPLTVGTGQVSALERRVEFERQTMTGLIQTDTDINPGNSGGPLIDVEGRVVGVIQAGRDGDGLGYAFPGDVAAEVVEAWRDQAPEDHSVDCPSPWEGLRIESRHPDAPAIAVSLADYFTGIHEGSYEDAYERLTGDGRRLYEDVEQFAERHESVYIEDVVVELADMVDETSDTADVRFRRDDVGDEAIGAEPTCTLEHVRFTMRIDEGYWLISDQQQLPDSGAPCPD